LKEITPVKVQQQAYVYFINEYVVFDLTKQMNSEVPTAV